MKKKSWRGCSLIAIVAVIAGCTADEVGPLRVGFVRWEEGSSGNVTLTLRVDNGGGGPADIRGEIITSHKLLRATGDGYEGHDGGVVLNATGARPSTGAHFLAARVVEPGTRHEVTIVIRDAPVERGDLYYVSYGVTYVADGHEFEIEYAPPCVDAEGRLHKGDSRSRPSQLPDRLCDSARYVDWGPV